MPEIVPETLNEFSHHSAFYVCPDCDARVPAWKVENLVRGTRIEPTEQEGVTNFVAENALVVPWQVLCGCSAMERPRW